MSVRRIYGSFVYFVKGRSCKLVNSTVMMRCLLWRRRSAACKRCLLLLLLASCVLIYAAYVTRKNNLCSEKDSHQLVDDLCELYSRGEVMGSLCSSLCRERQIKYDHCTNYRGGKRVIFMSCDSVCDKDKSVKTVFKVQTSLEERERLPVAVMSESQSEKYAREFLVGLIQGTFYSSIGVNITDKPDPLSFSWGWDFEQYILDNKNLKNVSYIAADSLFSLVSQQEYAFMKFYSENTFIPKIYGSCGPAYFLEFTESLSKAEYSLVSNIQYTWKERVRIALKLIDLMHVLDTDFHQPLHLCDIKPDNFGLRLKSEVNLIDVDCAMFEDKLMEQFKFSTCNTHDDCDFFDCRGFCDEQTKSCLQKRTNNNMQSVCEDVFIGFSSKFPMGILHDPPPSRRTAVFEALEHCAYPNGETSLQHTTRLPAPPEAVEELIQVLRKSLD